MWHRAMVFWIMRPDPKIALKDMRHRIDGGARLLLDSLSEDEMAAVYALIVEGKAEIICEACKPYVVRALRS